MFLVRVAKYAVLGAGDIKPLFVKTRDFLTTCDGEQIRYAKDTCKY